MAGGAGARGGDSEGVMICCRPGPGARLVAEARGCHCSAPGSATALAPHIYKANYRAPHAQRALGSRC